MGKRTVFASVGRMCNKGAGLQNKNVLSRNSTFWSTRFSHVGFEGSTGHNLGPVLDILVNFQMPLDPGAGRAGIQRRQKEVWRDWIEGEENTEKKGEFEKSENDYRIKKRWKLWFPTKRMSTLAFLLSLLLFFIPPAQLLIEKIWESEFQNVFLGFWCINQLTVWAFKDSEHNYETDEEDLSLWPKE